MTDQPQDEPAAAPTSATTPPPPPPPPPSYGDAPPPAPYAGGSAPGYGVPYGAELAIPPNVSSAGKRFGAALLEIPLAIVTLGIGWVIWDLIVWKNGQTPAKQLLNMRIVDGVTGQPIDWGRSFMRNFVFYGLLGAIPFLGWIYRIVGACFVFNPDRRAVWDRMANTFVVNEA